MASPPPYKLRSSSSTHTGGIFTTKVIWRGCAFLSEAPLLKCRAHEYPSASAFHTLRASSQRKFLALHNCHRALGARQLRSDTVRGIWQTNRVIVGNEEAVSDTACRPSHSCSPNAKLEWDLDTGRMEARALRRIEKGEEVTAAYVDCNLPLEERRKKLQGWGFVCVCLCTVYQ